jgi:hypothetical protein
LGDELGDSLGDDIGHVSSTAVSSTVASAPAASVPQSDSLGEDIGEPIERKDESDEDIGEPLEPSAVDPSAPAEVEVEVSETEIAAYNVDDVRAMIQPFQPPVPPSSDAASGPHPSILLVYQDYFDKPVAPQDSIKVMVPAKVKKVVRFVGLNPSKDLRYIGSFSLNTRFLFAKSLIFHSQNNQCGGTSRIASFDVDGRRARSLSSCLGRLGSACPRQF